MLWAHAFQLLDPANPFGADTPVFPFRIASLFLQFTPFSYTPLQTVAATCSWEAWVAPWADPVRGGGSPRSIEHFRIFCGMKMCLVATTLVLFCESKSPSEVAEPKYASVQISLHYAMRPIHLSTDTAGLRIPVIYRRIYNSVTCVCVA